MSVSNFREELIVGVNATEFGRVVQMDAISFRRKAVAKKLLLKDFKFYRDMQFPGFEGEPEIKERVHEYMSPARKDGEPFTEADREAVEAYYTALDADEDYELPEHIGMVWERAYQMGWYALVPNEFIKPDTN